MKYPRYAYGDPAAPSVTVKSFFGGRETVQPKFDYPISQIENFKRSARHQKPMWVPNSLTDFQSISPTDMIRPTEATKGQCVCMDFSTPKSGDYEFTDWFLTDWTYVHSAGGAMLTPGFKLCEDVTEWEKAVKFPDFDEWDWDTFRDDFMKNRYDPNKVLSVNIGLGCTERFVSVMGGYTEAMLAFAEEPDACRDFFEAFIDHEIAQFDRMMENYPITMLTYHDDWSNEKELFFSPAMLEDMVLEPTRRFVNHVKSRDVVFEFHICGNCARALPYLADIGVDLVQVQRRVMDIIKVKRDYGTKLGFGAGIEGLENNPNPTKDELIQMVRNTVDMFAPTGGFYSFLFLFDPEMVWNAATEFYAYSREFYDKENGAE